MVWDWGEKRFSAIGGLIGERFFVGGRDGWIFGIGGGGDRWHVGVAFSVTAMVGLALAATIVISSLLDVASRGSLKSPWSRRKRKHVLTPQLWKRFFTPEGKLYDGGARLLKKVRSGGVDPSIRHEVWPFLLGVYELNSSEDERNAVRKHKRKEYKKLRKRCQCLLKLCCESDSNMKEIDEIGHTSSLSSVSAGPDDAEYAEHHSSPTDQSDRDHTLHDEPFASEGMTKGSQTGTSHISMETSHGTIENSQDISEITNVDETESESSSSEDTERASLPLSSSSLKGHAPKSSRTVEDFTTWQRIIRLDAVRANAEWVSHAPSQAAVSEEKARSLANTVGLRNYDHLEPCMVYHAARLVVVLEAYAIYDPTIGYCQGMSDLLSPIVSVMEKDCDAFWCFVGFMTKARHNFRLDEVGIRRQLGIVSKIIKFKDPHLYKHLEKLQAEDCFFVYRMVVVLFRRELSFEQTLCLWEVMWADQSAIRSGLGKSAWARIRLRAPPTDDLLLYAIAACVLQRRKLIIERYSSMDEILRECNNMAGRLDVWKLLDDAHDLVVTLHDKIS